MFGNDFGFKIFSHGHAAGHGLTVTSPPPPTPSTPPAIEATHRPSPAAPQRDVKGFPFKKNSIQEFKLSHLISACAAISGTRLFPGQASEPCNRSLPVVFWEKGKASKTQAHIQYSSS
jgi:hypothetical protein